MLQKKKYRDGQVTTTNVYSEKEKKKRPKPEKKDNTQYFVQGQPVSAKESGHAQDVFKMGGGARELQAIGGGLTAPGKELETKRQEYFTSKAGEEAKYQFDVEQQKKELARGALSEQGIIPPEPLKAAGVTGEAVQMQPQSDIGERIIGGLTAIGSNFNPFKLVRGTLAVTTGDLEEPSTIEKIYDDMVLTAITAGVGADIATLGLGVQGVKAVPATAKQVAYMRHLGIAPKAGVTMAEATKAISAATGRAAIGGVTHPYGVATAINILNTAKKVSNLAKWVVGGGVAGLGIIGMRRLGSAKNIADESKASITDAIDGFKMGAMSYADTEEAISEAENNIKRARESVKWITQNKPISWVLGADDTAYQLQRMIDETIPKKRWELYTTALGTQGGVA